MARIVNIERRKRPPRSVGIVFDDGAEIVMHESVFSRFNLSIGVDMTPEHMRALEREQTVYEAKAAADRYLARRPRSVHEVRKHLMRRGIDEAFVERAISDFLDAGLLDDTAFARAFVRDRLAFRPKSRWMIARELRTKGVPDETVQTVLADVFPAETEIASAMALAKKYLARAGSGDPARRNRRLFAYLRRRGYDSASIRSVFHELGLGEGEEQTE
ncbi:MAG: regulatory protein RecX [Bacteroidota bacterium]|nr:regulatory protein RecX [Bacteroidota bacterium]